MTAQDTVGEKEPYASPVLDPAQLVRIESVHRGFLYQHLYAAGCMLMAGRVGAAAVVVDRDEDIEIQFAERRLYAQVKTRASALNWSDIESAVARFDELRRLHAEGVRSGRASFVVVSNVAPGPALRERLASADQPADVKVAWPGQSVDVEEMPAPQPDVSSAFAQCTALAADLPFARLAAETLVWKLAGVVMTAAAGASPYAGHKFEASELPSLFEQIAIELSDFPSVPSGYRPQEHEPALESAQSVRLVIGFSGAGKTAWASHTAQHAAGHVVYFDVVDMPGPALANGIARELAARLFQRRQGGLGEILLPGASGPEILGLIDRRLAASGETVTIVLDNAHRVPAEDLLALIRRAESLRFFLLAQPGENVAELAASLSLAPERLEGWSTDTIAAEVAAQECRGGYRDCERLLKLTAGMPLYVRNAIAIARQEYGGAIRSLCDDLEALTHTAETAQELILRRIFDKLSAEEKNGISILNIADIPLERELVDELLGKTRGMGEASIAAMLRPLRSRGLIEVYVDGRVKVHDAMRLLAQAHLAALGPERAREAQRALKDILSASMVAKRNFAKLSLFLRLLSVLGDVKTLVQFATDELFHELGFRPDLMAFLKTAAESEQTPPEDRFWALDGLVFSDAKRGELAETPAYLDLMDRLVAEHNLGPDERLAVAMKRMSVLAAHGDAAGVAAAMRDVAEQLPNKPEHQRIYRYNAARALWSLKQYRAAADEAMRLIQEYYGVLGIKPAEVIGRNAAELRKLLGKNADRVDDLKHLADSLDLRATALTDIGDIPLLERVHALKFYQLAHSIDSLVRVAQDLVDDFVSRNDFVGAREVIENHLLPSISELKMVGRVVPVRSQYAVVLAYCGELNAAEAEMARLALYEAGLDEKGQWELRNQRKLIAQLRISGPPPQRQMPTLPPPQRRVGKVGRNHPCPCGSGQKYKKCHGR